MRPTTRTTTARYLALAVALGVGVAIVPGSAMAKPGTDRIVTKISGLDGPRDIAAGPPRRLIYTESDGTLSQAFLRGDHAGSTLLGSVPSTGFAPAVSQYDRNSAFILTGGDKIEGAATLYMWSRESGDITAVADIAAYQMTDPDPYNQTGKKTETNPYGLASLPDGSALVADAANNDLLRVHPDGTIETVARLKPRIVLVPDELDGQPGVPPPGTPINAEAVATSITVGADGAYYVGELRGFPATPGTSEIWRIEPDSVNAVCDPDAPDVGTCTRFADGLTSIVDLATGPDGDIYSVSLCKQSWLQFELGIAEPIGGLYRIPAAGGDADLMSSDRLQLPGGVAVTSRGKAFVTTPVFGQGAIVRVN